MAPPLKVVPPLDMVCLLGFNGVKCGMDINWLDDQYMSNFSIARRRVAGLLIDLGAGGLMTGAGGYMVLIGIQ